MPVDLETFLKRLARESRGRKPKLPAGFYIPEGDCYEFFTESVDYLAEYVDPHLSIYRARDDNRVVGAMIHGLTAIICRNMRRAHPQRKKAK